MCNVFLYKNVFLYYIFLNYQWFCLYIFLFFFENSVCFTEVKHYTNIIYGITLHRSTSSFFLPTLNSTICLTHSISLRKLSLSLVYLVYLVKYFISRVNIWKCSSRDPTIQCNLTWKGSWIWSTHTSEITQCTLDYPRFFPLFDNKDIFSTKSQNAAVVYSIVSVNSDSVLNN